MKKSSINIIGLALSAALFLTSCAGGGAEEPGTGPEPTATLHETTGPEETPEPEEPVVEEPVEPEEPELTAEDYEVGEVLPEKPENLPQGVKVYEVASGDLVVVKKDEPLPKTVKEDVQKVVDDNVPYPDGTATIGPGVVYAAAGEQAGVLRGKTGRNIVVITPTITSCDPHTDAFLQWAHSPVHYLDNPTKCEQFTFKSRDNAIAAVEKRISELDDPETYEIIIRKNSK